MREIENSPLEARGVRVVVGNFRAPRRQIVGQTRQPFPPSLGAADYGRIDEQAFPSPWRPRSSLDHRDGI